MKRYEDRFLWTRRKIDPADTAALKAVIEVDHHVEFWGRKFTVVPRLLDRIFGDGKKLVVIEPLNTRPNYYVVRGDSNWIVRQEYDSAPGVDIYDVLDDIYNAIEEEFGSVDSEQDESEEDVEFPVLDLWSGCSWGRHAWPDKPSTKKGVVAP